MHDFTEQDLILITGASSGIGKACVNKLNKTKARLVCISRNLTKLQHLKEEAANPDCIFLEPKDLSKDMDNLPDFIQSLSEKYGKFSGFVHSAGVFNTTPLKAWDYNSAIEDFNLNYFSAIEITKALSRKKNKQELLSIVYISSEAALCGGTASSVYSATKAALINSVKTLTMEIGKNRIRLNSVMPGNIETDMTKEFNKECDYDYFKMVCDRTPFSEAGKPEYVANLVYFLLSKESYWIQGQNIIINGAEKL